MRFIPRELQSKVNQGHRRQLYYFRDEQGLEVDFLVPGVSGSVSFVECKATRTILPAMAQPMQRLAEAWRRTRSTPAAVTGFVVHELPQGGLQTRALVPGIQAVDWLTFVKQL